MKLKFILPAALLAFLFAFTDEVTAPLRIKRVTNLQTGSYMDYYYDSLNRASLFRSSAGTQMLFHYFPGLIVKITTNPAAESYGVDSIFLDENGRVKTISGNTMGNQDVFCDMYGKFIEAKVVSPNGEVSRTEREWTNENVNTCTVYGSAGETLNFVAYQYFTYSNTIADANRGMDFWGTDSKNLVRKTMALGPDTATGKEQVTYKYWFDERGAVRLMVGKNAQGKLVDSTAYTYY